MYSRILVPLDGSPLAEQVLPIARVLAQGLSARLALLRAVELILPELTNPAMALEIRQRYHDQELARLTASTSQYLEQVAAPLRQAGLRVDIVSPEGRPADAIVSEAQGDPDTLIAMSTHGRSGAGRLVLGSVADRVLHATGTPLLLVRGREDGDHGDGVSIDTVVVPLDGSPLAEEALSHGVALAQALKKALLLVRVTPSVADHYRSGTPAGDEDPAPLEAFAEYSERIDAQAEEYLTRVAGTLEGKGLVRVEHRVLHHYPTGTPADALGDLGRDAPNHVVVMTTHGRTGIGRWFLGSVTDRVVRHGAGPVLVVRSRSAS